MSRRSQKITLSDPSLVAAERNRRTQVGQERIRGKVVYYLRKPNPYTYSELYNHALNNPDSKPLPKKSGIPFAVLVADRQGDTLRFGWAHCCRADTPNKKRALDIALSRLNHFNPEHVTNEIVNHLPMFAQKAEKKLASDGRASLSSAVNDIVCATENRRLKNEAFARTKANYND